MDWFWGMKFFEYSGSGTKRQRLIWPPRTVELLLQPVSFLAEVAQLTAVAPLFFKVERYAGIEGLGVDVQADAARGSCVFDLVDGLELVDGDHAGAFSAI
jgi:hypothetical protein